MCTSEGLHKGEQSIKKALTEIPYTERPAEAKNYTMSYINDSEKSLMLSSYNSENKSWEFQTTIEPMSKTSFETDSNTPWAIHKALEKEDPIKNTSLCTSQVRVNESNGETTPYLKVARSSKEYVNPVTEHKATFKCNILRMNCQKNPPSCTRSQSGLLWDRFKTMETLRP